VFELAITFVTGLLIGLSAGTELMVWLHDNKRGRYRNGCRRNSGE
jgi:hypothetical protein